MVTNAHNFVFVRPFSCKMGEIPANAEICIIDDRILFNSIPVEPWWYEFFSDFIKSELEKPYYLREIPFRTNVGKMY